ncbi:MAG: Sua5 family C-terminal domain-containing protein, partial [Capsulimonadales bacterium]|nr:Sua5 family C-terminal domain-containing protein [Capsulimonadales bacterium]
AAHVADPRRALADDFFFLEGGPWWVVLVSTVLFLRVEPPVFVGRGGIDRTLLRAVVGDVEEDDAGSDIARSPGQRARHYAPRAKVLLVRTDLLSLVLAPGDGLIAVGNRSSVEYAAALYADLRRLDRREVARIIVEMPPQGPEWQAIHDRLKRAATQKVDR